MIKTGNKPKIHWNYFLSLEDDLLQISRFIEINPDNDKTYSIELAKLLLSASSEVDVVLKAICKPVEKKRIKNMNMNIYRNCIKNNIPDFVDEKVFINRYELTLWPWQKWIKDENPDWWQGYNNVKHKRSEFFREAKLNYVLNSIAGLLVSVFWYYKLTLVDVKGNPIKDERDVFNSLKPRSRLLSLNEEYYY